MTISGNNKIITSLQFSYGAPEENYKRFESKYKPEGFLPSLFAKIIIIPKALTVGIIKIIFHLARAIFQGIPQIFMGNKLPLQADIYHLVRDLQHILGTIVSIFNDKLGLYICQNGNFQKSCYDNVIKDNLYVVKYMSGDQIKKLNLENITDLDLARMLDRRLYIDADIKNQFANLTVKQVQDILPKLDGDGFSYISDEQFKGLDLKDLSKKSTDTFFPTLSKEIILKTDNYFLLNTEAKQYKTEIKRRKERNTTKSPLLSDKEFNQIEDQVQKVMQNTIKERTQLNTTRLARLSDDQFNQIKDKLQPAIQNLRK